VRLVVDGGMAKEVEASCDSTLNDLANKAMGLVTGQVVVATVIMEGQEVFLPMEMPASELAGRDIKIHVYDALEQLRACYKSLTMSALTTQELSKVWLRLVDRTEQVAVEKLFDGGVTRVMAQGRAGVGKSTLAKYMCQQWVLGKLWNDRFDAVVLVPLLEVSKCENVEAALEQILRVECVHALW
jgi:predicted ribonuclease YlaK